MSVVNPTFALLSYPLDIIYSIADELNLRDIHALLLTSRRLNVIFTPFLYKYIDQHKNYVLTWAAKNHREELLRIALDKGADIHSFFGGSTALHLASQTGWDDGVAILLDRGGDIEGEHQHLHQARLGGGIIFGMTPLRLAARNGHESTVNLLIQRGANLHTKQTSNFTLLHMVAEGGLAGVTASLIHDGFDVNARSRRGGISPLHLAVVKGHINVVKILLENRADIDAKLKTGGTALHIAIGTGNLNMIETIITSGADINARDDMGKTVLLKAIIHRYTKTMDLLLRKGADVNIADSAGRTPLLQAIKRRDEGLLRAIIEKGGDINPTGHIGRSILVWALYGTKELLEILIENGLDIHQEFEGSTVLHVAALNVSSSSKGMEIFQVLLEKGIDIDIRDREGRTVLHWAVKERDQRYVPLIKFLLKSGTNLNACDLDGKSPLQSAKRAQRFRCDGVEAEIFNILEKAASTV